MGEEEFGGVLGIGGGRENVEGGGYPGCKDLHRKCTSDSGIVGGPLAHI